MILWILWNSQKILNWHSRIFQNFFFNANSKSEKNLPFYTMCLSSLFKELWPFENHKMYRNVLKFTFQMARTPWKMYPSAWNFPGRCSCEFCEIAKKILNWHSRIFQKFFFQCQLQIWKSLQFYTMCLSSLFKELWPFEYCKIYRNVLKIHFQNFIFQSEHVSSQIWCQKFFPLLGESPPPQKKSCSKWAETNFGFGIFEIQWFPGGGVPLWDTARWTDTRHSDQISCSARRDGAAKNSNDIHSHYISTISISFSHFQV